MYTVIRKLNAIKKAGKICLPVVLLVLLSQTGWAAGPPGQSLFSNSLALTLLALMLTLLVIIAFLSYLLVNTADMKVKKRKSVGSVTAVLILTFIFLLQSSVLTAQDATQADGTNQTVKAAETTIGGLSPSTFYIMTSIIFLELFIILTLLINIRFLLKTEKGELGAVTGSGRARASRITWWGRMNKFRPMEQEADIDLGHDYDGIRELDNRLPPWWLYGFYVTIIFSVIYLWRFHVSHAGPTGVEEYNRSVARAELKLQEYLKLKGESVNENTVTVLTGADDIAAGKKIFVTSCAACHKDAGGGDVGPNLTDEYWMHGGDIKSIFKVVKYGINAMPQWQNAYSNKQIAQVSSFIKSLKGTNPPNPKAPQGEIFKEDAAPATPISDSAATKENKVAAN